MAAEGEDEPPAAPLHPSAAGQEESPFADFPDDGPPHAIPVPAEPVPPDGANGSNVGNGPGHDATAVPSPFNFGGVPRRVHLGRINIGASGVGRIRIHRAGGAPTGPPGHPPPPHGAPPQHHHHRMPLGPMEAGMTNPMLPPLEPRPMGNRTSGEDGGAVDAAVVESNDNMPPSAKDMKRFECAICFEYMDRPTGCGSCQTRFCQSCLHRVLREQANNRPPQSTDPPNSARCPHCRSFFTLQTMAIDLLLLNEIRECTETVTCPYAGCGGEMRIGLLKSHEAACPYIRMRCRYADWGCGWTGRKMDVERHDRDECDFRGGLGTLVERFRQGDARAGHIIQQHHMQIGAASQMLSLHSRQLMMMRGRNAGNLIDALGLAYEVSLFPGRFSAMREVWSGMINHLEARCAVCNSLLLLPSLVLVLRVLFQGLRLMSKVQIESLTSEDVWFIADVLLLSLIVALLGVLCVACFFIDARGSTGWTVFNVRDLVPGQPLLRDLAAVCVAMIHFGAIEFAGLHPGVMLWHFAAVATVWYPAFVSRVVEKNVADVAEASDAGTAASARARPVVVFGLRYGLLTAACGLAPTANAVAALRLCRRVFDLPPNATAEDAECFLAQFGGAALWAASALITTFAYGALGDDGTDDGVASWRIVALDLLFALTLLAYVNAMVFLLDGAGRRLGEYNFHVGNAAFMRAHRATGAAVPNVEPTAVGCAVLGVCSFLLLGIAAG